MVERNLQQILDANSELEVSEWSADLEPGSHGTDPAPLHQQPGQPPLATEGEVQEKPRRRRKVTQAAPTEGSNGSEPSLTETFLLTGQVAGLLRVHQGSVLRIVARGDLPAVKIGGRLRVPAVALEEFLAARRVRPKAWAVRKRNARSSGSMLDLA